VPRLCAYGVAVTAVLVYASLASRRLPVWRNSVALWEQAYERNPKIPVVRIQWAYALHDAGRKAEAIAMLQTTLVETNPDEADRKRILRRLDEWGTDQAATSTGAPRG
jgi:thioredoxin-like negative regulator of GroEL